MFLQRKQNAQIILQMSSNKHSCIRSFQSHANSSREYKNRTFSTYFVWRLLTSKLDKYIMRKSQLRMLIYFTVWATRKGNVDINILIINKLNSATNIINHSQSGFIIASKIWFNLKRKKYLHKIYCINRLGQRNIW